MTLLDIRTEREYCNGHLCGAINIPTPLPPLNQAKEEHLWNQLSNWVVDNYDGKEVKVYCKKGIRARLATKMLRQMGINAINIGGVETTLRGLDNCYCQE